MRRIAILVASFITAACSGSVPAEELAVTELLRGNHSQQTERRFEVIRSQPELVAVWRELDGRLPPMLDFDRHTLIAVFMGQNRTGGYSIEVERVVREGDRMTVHVLMRSPGAGCYTTQALTQPFQLVSVPAGAATAEFIMRSIAVSCE